MLKFPLSSYVTNLQRVPWTLSLLASSKGPLLIFSPSSPPSSTPHSSLAGSSLHLNKLLSSNSSRNQPLTPPLLRTTALSPYSPSSQRLSYTQHITTLTRTCRFFLSNIRRIRPFLTDYLTQLLVQSLVLSCLDYCNSLLAGLPASTTNLGVICDHNLSFESYVQNVSRSSFLQLRNIARLRQFLSLQDTEKLIHTFVTSRLDYCNAILSGKMLLQRILTKTTCVKTVSSELSQVDFYASTTDLWSSRTTEPYMSFSVNFLTEDLELKTRCLGVVYFPESHTSENIAHGLREVLTSWNLKEENQVCITTDNGANVVKATELNNWVRLQCFGQRLHLAIENAIKGDERITQAVGLCKKLVGHFSHSWKEKMALKKAQKGHNLPEHYLITECPTRWGSREKMIEQSLSNQHHQGMGPSDVILKKAKKSLGSFFKASPAPSSMVPLHAVGAELNSYLVSPTIDSEMDPLTWWQLHQINFPHLSKLARKYLCILATNSPSERLFSTS
ncbi:ZBED1 protein, partial [Amia calva]|nr:ZBED1 protein [Amia calva]